MLLEPLLRDLAPALVIVPVVIRDHIALAPHQELRFCIHDLRIVIITPWRRERDVFCIRLQQLRIEGLPAARMHRCEGTEAVE